MRPKKHFTPPRPVINVWITRKFRRFLRVLLAIFLLGFIALAGLFVHIYRSYARIVDARLARGYLTSQAGIYAAPRILRPGQKYSSAGLAVVLRRAGYIESNQATEIWNGSFSVTDSAFEIRPNNTSFERVNISFNSERIEAITADSLPLDSFTLAPEPLTNDSVMKTAARSQL